MTRTDLANLRSGDLAIEPIIRERRGVRRNVGRAMKWPSRHITTSPSAPGFSLVEVLLAIFILGIGVISIAALFPAGIAQQRLTNDDVMGPMVANQAMSLLRTRVTADDFGTFENDFGIITGDVGYGDTANDKRPTLVGDWPWIRPAIVTSRDPDQEVIYPDPPVPTGTDVDTRGAIDIFSWYAFTQSVTGGSFDSPVSNLTEFPNSGGHPSSVPARPLFGVPFNTIKYPPLTALSTVNTLPRILILQNERFYPMAPRTYVPPGDAAYAQYAWDCMFRRFQGKIQVAIFVYRINMAGGASANNFHVSPASGSALPSIPWRRNLLSGFSPLGGGPGAAWHAGGVDRDYFTTADNNIVLGTANGTAYNPLDWNQAWQEPRQWLLDTNNNIHRVLSIQRVGSAGPPGIDPSQGTSGNVWVELARPVAPVRGERNTFSTPLPTLCPYFYRDNPDDPPFPSGGGGSREYMAEKNIVTDLWYVPLQMEITVGVPPGAGTVTANLTPVYVSVQEL